MAIIAMMAVHPLARQSGATPPQTGSLPACDSSDAKVWSRGEESIGLFVTDDQRTIGGAYGGKKFSETPLGQIGNELIAGYYPASGFKEMACGTVDHWTLYKLGSRELDLHPHLALSPSYQHLLTGVPGPRSKGQAKDTCEGCIWGEVTVPENFQWFWKQDAVGAPSKGSNACGRDKPCAGKTLDMRERMCVYGPWVMEKAHEFHVEIHPVQALWGRTTSTTQLFLVDDASDRFQRAEYFKSAFLSTPLRPWSGRLNAQVFQVVRINPNAGATVAWRDIGGEPSETKTLDTGAGRLSVSSPRWINLEVVRACRAGAETQVVLETSLTNTPGSWRGVEISGTGTGHGGLVAKPTPAGSDEVEEPWELTSATEWNGIADMVRRSLPGNAQIWDLDPGHDNWSAVREQRVILKIAQSGDPGVPLPATIQSEWRVVVRDLDRPTELVAPSRVRAELEYPRRLTTVSTPGVLRRDTSRSDEFAVTVQFPTTAIGPAVRVNNYHVDIQVEVTDGKRKESRTFALYAIVPNFLGAVSGYDLRREKAAFPERLARASVRLVQNNGCPSLTFPKFQADVSGTRVADFSPAGLWQLTNHRLRAAGVVRQTVNYLLQDKTLTRDEFSEFTNVLRTYARACRNDP
jgi:hypothetical protein